MQLSPSEHTVELFSDGLAALENINDAIDSMQNGQSIGRVIINL